MTYIEKYMQVHPDCEPQKFVHYNCVEDFFPVNIDDCHDHDCEFCWTREMSEEDLCGSCNLLKVVDDKKTCPHVDRKFTEKVIECVHHKTFKEELHNLVEKIIEDDKPMIKDSGARREFETGAVRDIQEGKGRCDLLPLDVVARFRGQVLTNISEFQETGDIKYLENALQRYIDKHYDKNMSTVFLEVSKHFEEGAKKYGEYNWQKGIPTHCYIDSAVRHYLKYLRGDKDEPHDRAFVWNILCCIWTCIHKPELNDYGKKEEKNV